MRCSVLQCVAVCCSVLQCVHPSVVAIVAIVPATKEPYQSDIPEGHNSPLTQCVAVCCSVLQCVAVCCRRSRTSRILRKATIVRQRSVLQCVAVCCSVLQNVAVCCSVLQKKPYHSDIAKGHNSPPTHSAKVLVQLRLMLPCVCVCVCVCVSHANSHGRLAFEAPAVAPHTPCIV